VKNEGKIIQQYNIPSVEGEDEEAALIPFVGILEVCRR
jgi:hypothetical protein